MPLDFEKFSGLLKARLLQPLPGAKSHEPMRAVAIGDLKPNFEHKTPPKPGSVLILLYPDEGRIMFPLTQRPEYTGAHSGQVSLPGGKAEPGETPEETAIREGEEEIGVHPANIEVIGRLTEFFVIPSNFLIVPVVAIQRNKPLFVPDPVEVVRIIYTDVGEIIREGAIMEKEILAARTYRLRAPHFLVEDQVVWGATAMMLNEFRDVVKEIIQNTSPSPM